MPEADFSEAMDLDEGGAMDIDEELARLENEKK
jgi:hypothetical protein